MCSLVDPADDGNLAVVRPTLGGNVQIFTLLLGVFVGAAFTCLLLAPRRRALACELRDQRDQFGALNEANASLRAVSARLEEKVESERRRANDRIATFELASGQMNTSFEAISGKVLRQSASQLTELVRTELRSERTASSVELQEKQRQLSELVSPLGEALGKVELTLARSERDRAAADAALRARIEAVTAAQQELGQETGRLVTALRRPHTRGRWGEMQLRNVVAAAGMEGFSDFSSQPNLAADGGALRPDLIVRLPGAKLAVVDAKAPLDAYIDAHEAEDEATATKHRQRHAAQMLTHIEKLGAKQYWAHVPESPDMVIMFVPGEHFLSAALEHNARLIEQAAEARVMLATPATLITLLGAVHHGWQQEQLATDAQQIAELGRKIHAYLSGYVSHVENLGRHLGRSVNAYNRSVATLQSRLLPAARKLDSHGISAGGKQLGDPQPIDLTARELQGPDSPPALPAPDKQAA